MVEVICELGSNWFPRYGETLIKACADAGVSSVKFQLWRATDLYGEDWQKYKPYELSLQKFKEFKQYGDRVGIEVFASCFYIEAVDFLESLGRDFKEGPPIKWYKIASRTAALKDLNSLSILKRISETGKPVIISTGYRCDWQMLRNLFPRATYLNCVPKYPADMRDFNFGKRGIQYQYEDGYSNHIPSIYPCIAAVCRNAKIIETHVMLHQSFRDKTPDGCCSITVAELQKLMKVIRGLEGCL